MSVPKLSYKEYVFRALNDEYALHCKKHGLVPLHTKTKPRHDIQCPACEADQKAKQA